MVDSEAYVNNIVDFIQTIPIESKRKCKDPMHGEYFAKYRAPKSKTHYYITYNENEGRYLIKNIFNNKEQEYTAIFEEN